MRTFAIALIAASVTAKGYRAPAKAHRPLNLTHGVYNDRYEKQLYTQDATQD
jgi:hypothetical protein